jgi:hypothetical protein
VASNGRNGSTPFRGTEECGERACLSADRSECGIFFGKRLFGSLFYFSPRRGEAQRRNSLKVEGLYPDSEQIFWTQSTPGSRKDRKAICNTRFVIRLKTTGLLTSGLKTTYVQLCVLCVLCGKNKLLKTHSNSGAVRRASLPVGRQERVRDNFLESDYLGRFFISRHDAEKQRHNSLKVEGLYPDSEKIFWTQSTPGSRKDRKAICKRQVCS